MKSLDLGTKQLTKRYKQMTPGQEKRITTIKKVVSEAVLNEIRSGAPAGSTMPKGGLGLVRNIRAGFGSTKPRRSPGGLGPVEKTRARQGERTLTNIRRKRIAPNTARETVRLTSSERRRRRITANQSREAARQRSRISPQ